MRANDPEAETHRRLLQAVELRWPGERVLFVAPCHVERTATRAEWLLGLLGRAHCPQAGCVVDDTTRRRDEALLGITEARLVHRTRTRQGLLSKVLAGGVALLALVVLVEGSVMGSVVLAAVAVGLWGLGVLAGAFGTGSGSIPFERIRRIDGSGRRIEGAGTWGTRYALLIPDADDFLTIASLVLRHEGPAAA